MSEPDEIDLGRMTSSALTEVRTVLSRAETAMWVLHREQDLILEHGKWERNPETGKCGYAGRVEIPHPELDDMRRAMAQVVALLESWQKTGKSRNGGR